MDEEMNLSTAPADPSPAADDLRRRPRFHPRETLFAWLLLLFGYFFWRVFPMSQKPVSAALLLVSIYAFTFLVMLRGRCRFEPASWLVLISAALALLAALLWDNRFHSFLCFAYLIAAYAYLVTAVTGCCLEGTWSELLGADLLRSWIIFPFSSFGKLFPALVPPRGKGVGRALLKVLLGLLLAVIPTVVAFALLSFDSRFLALTEKLFRFETEDAGWNLLRFHLGIPVAMYIFGLYVSTLAGRQDGASAAERVRAKVEKRRILPLLSAAAAVIPLLLVYVLFFISQWEYYVSAFTGILPARLGYAEYARDGFFQLCAVVALNFLVLLGLSRYVRRSFERFRRALCVVVALFTLILIATAVSKLWLYVTRFGLSPDRLHAAWFMLLLTILFVLVLIRQFVPRFKALPLALAVTVSLFLIFALSGSNRMIARYNVDRYLSGYAKHVDVSLLSSLGDDAVADMLRLDAYWNSENDAPDSHQHERLQNALRECAAEDRNPWRQTLSSRRASRLLEESGYLADKG